MYIAIIRCSHTNGSSKIKHFVLFSLYTVRVSIFCPGDCIVADMKVLLKEHWGHRACFLYCIDNNKYIHIYCASSTLYFDTTVSLSNLIFT